MATPKAYFEQIPLVIVKKIVKEQAAQRKVIAGQVNRRQQWAKKKRRIKIPRVAKAS
jgi:hypothetical protein